MSCFICDEQIFKSVAKVCFQYGIRQKERTNYPLTLEELNEFTKKVAELNCRNVATRYNEDEMEASVELFSDIPLESVTVQDIKNCDCWQYQTCDYFDDDELFKMVQTANGSIRAMVEYTDEDYERANWG